MRALIEQLNLVTRDDIERLAVRNSPLVLGSSSDNSAVEHPYSFEHEEFIHPLIVRELLGWISDPAASVVSIDLTIANRSNRFHGEYQTRMEGARTWVTWSGDGSEPFAYVYVGTSPSGIQMVECYDCGGSAIFGYVGLFSIEHDRALDEKHPSLLSRRRVIIKTLGSVSLGDRYSGTIVYSDGILQIGPDEGYFGRGIESAKALPVR